MDVAHRQVQLVGDELADPGVARATAGQEHRPLMPAEDVDPTQDRERGSLEGGAVRTSAAASGRTIWMPVPALTTSERLHESGVWVALSATSAAAVSAGSNCQGERRR